MATSNPIARLPGRLRRCPLAVTGRLVVATLLSMLACGLVPAPLVADDAVRLSMDTPYLELSATESGDEVRWLSVFVTVSNQTDKEIRIPPNAWQLRDARGTHGPAPFTEAFTTQYDLVDDDERVALEAFQLREVTVKPGKQERVGLFFQPLAFDLRRPDLNLTLAIDKQQLATIDLAQLAGDSLLLTSRRIGPARAIGLLKIDGELNSLNATGLVRELNKLSDDERVLRFVIELNAETRVADNGVMAWLRQVATQTGLSELSNDRFPQLSSDILAVHLTESPSADDKNSSFDRLQAEHYDNVHPNPEAAIEAAVIPLCERLPRETLLAELRTGETVSRQVVLRYCGERLVDDDLPTILGFLTSEHESLRLASLETLRHFETPSAVAALTAAAASKDEETAIAALSAMTTSRYGRVRNQLLELLNSSDMTLRQRATRALAQHPQPDWAPRILELAGDADAEIRRSALIGLIALGHPQLNELLRDGLKSNDDAIRQLSLRYLMSSHDSENERLAIDAVLKQLETSPPSRAVTLFLKRVRDRRVTPQVRRWLNSETPRVRRRVVQIMLAAGEPSVLDELAREYASLGATEQTEILNALYNASSKDFWNLAPQSLHSKRGRLLEVTAELLRRDGSDRAVSLLSDSLNDETLAASKRALPVCQTLAAIATPAARGVLIKHVKDGPPTLKAASTAALQQLYARSPAVRYVFQGTQLLNPMNPRYNPTLARLHFNLAVETDPDHPESRIARADITLKAVDPSQEELQAAREDLRAATRLDPSSSNALTCLGLTEVRLGAIESGIRIVEDQRERFNDDSLYHYNTACIYGRAIESLEARLKLQSPPSEALQKTIEKYRAQAVRDLRQSIETGLDEHNRNWMRDDPDLETIRQSPEFEKLFEDEIVLPPIPAELN